MTRFLAALSLVVASACATSPDPGDHISPPLDPAPPPGGQQLATDSYKLAPGDETYMCYQFYSPDDAVAITRLESIVSTGVHHFVVYRSMGVKEDDAPHECKVIIKTSWIPIWATGTGSHSIDLPEGTGFVIQPHTQYVVQIHLQNATDADLEIRTGVNITYQHDVSSITAAGLYGVGTFDLDIPPNVDDYTKTITCKPSHTLNVFTVFPHMHKIGTKLEVTQSTAGAAATPFYAKDPWVFGDQPMDPVTKVVTPDDTLTATCHYKNTSTDHVVYGESSDNEMCFFVMFYYPYSGLDGCIQS